MVIGVNQCLDDKRHALTVRSRGNNQGLYFACAARTMKPLSAKPAPMPEPVRTKAEIMSYLRDSFRHLDRALAAINNGKKSVHSSPISPLPGKLALSLDRDLELIQTGNFLRNWLTHFQHADGFLWRHTKTLAAGHVKWTSNLYGEHKANMLNLFLSAGTRQSAIEGRGGKVPPQSQPLAETTR